MDAEVKMLTPIKAIRAKCLDCTCGSPQEVRLCPTPDCPLYPYRMGHNPNRKGKGGKFTAQVAETSDGTEDENWYTALDDSKIPCDESEGNGES